MESEFSNPHDPVYHNTAHTDLVLRFWDMPASRPLDIRGEGGGLWVEGVNVCEERTDAPTEYFIRVRV